MPIATLSFKKAAEKVLREANAPLSPREIVERALDAGLIATEGATPDATMGAQIYLDLRDNPKSPFRKVGRGKFTVRTLESSASSAEVTVDRQNQLVRRELCEKLLAMWPLPGGIDAYVTTLFQLLDTLSVRPMTKAEMIRWFMTTFSQVRSEKTAGGYVNVPRAIGMTEMVDGKFRLTTEGQRVQDTKSRDHLYSVFAKSILGVEEIMEFFKTSDAPQTEADVMAFLKENLGVEWTTFAQVNFRLLWLVNLGKLKRTDGGYALA